MSFDSGAAFNELLAAVASNIWGRYRQGVEVDAGYANTLLKLIRDEPTNSDLKETARFLSRHMVDRVDALLGWLQDNG